jgi:hypothetical protein
MTKLSGEERDELPESRFAFPKQRKEPIEDAAHVHAAVARFNQVTDVTDMERDEAWKPIMSAAKKHGIELEERS